MSKAGDKSVIPIPPPAAVTDPAELIRGHVRRTYGPRVLGPPPGFVSGLRIDFNEKLFKRNYREPVLMGTMAGSGAKATLATTCDFRAMGQDVVAMAINDLVAAGAEPLFVQHHLSGALVDASQIVELIAGLADGCELAACALLGGEGGQRGKADHPSGSFDLVASAVGVSELSRVVDGTRAEAGDAILGLSGTGIHAQAFEAVLRIIRDAELQVEHPFAELNAPEPLGRLLLAPTHNFGQAIVSLLRKYKVKQVVTGMAPVAAGGLIGSLSRILGDRLNAQIDATRLAAPPIFHFLQARGSLGEEEMFGTFSMGIGFMISVKPHFADAVMRHLNRKGESARVIGKLVRGTGRVLLK